MFNALGDRPGIASWAFAIFVGLVLPAVAIRQHYALKSGAMAAPTRAQIYTGAFLTHAVLLAAVWATARLDDLWLFPSHRADARDALVAGVALALGLVLLIERFRVEDPLARERSRLIAPTTPREHAAFYAMAVSAGFAEQLAFRGVLFSIALSVAGNWWAAALLAAIPFGLVHVFQGWRSAAMVTVIALRDQIVVALTGTLVFAIVIHILHDMIAGTVLGRRARREENALAI